ncbi:hypothetical protein BSLG_000681 [Batrachochytrium salamandrivorans]|nr:hypothetical protein BASA83_002263 [Batrachochytrium salamandrivorans]KAJ1345166.1 hypothetical protein BSLG_000681 [Batrachochytrium salamandrivorans]
MSTCGEHVPPIVGSTSPASALATLTAPEMPTRQQRHPDPCRPSSASRQYQRQRKHARRRHFRQSTAIQRQLIANVASEATVCCETTPQHAEQERIWILREKEFEAKRQRREMMEKSNADRLQRVKDNWGDAFQTLQKTLQNASQAEAAARTKPSHPLPAPTSLLQPTPTTYLVANECSIDTPALPTTVPVRPHLSHEADRLLLIMQSTHLQIAPIVSMSHTIPASSSSVVVLDGGQASLCSHGSLLQATSGNNTHTSSVTESLNEAPLVASTVLKKEATREPPDPPIDARNEKRECSPPSESRSPGASRILDVASHRADTDRSHRHHRRKRSRSIGSDTHLHVCRESMRRSHGSSSRQRHRTSHTSSHHGRHSQHHDSRIDSHSRRDDHHHHHRKRHRPRSRSPTHRSSSSRHARHSEYK